MIDGSWRGDLLVRDAASGEIAIHQTGARVSLVTTTVDRLTWLYTRDSRLVVHRWHFDANRPVALNGGPEIHGLPAVAMSADGRLVASASYLRLEVWSLDGERMEKLAERAVGPTGTERRSLGTRAVTHSPTREVPPRSCSHRDSNPSGTSTSTTLRNANDNHDGTLLAIGDWSKGAVITAPRPPS